MPTDLKINYLEFPAEDFDAVQRFYEKSFAWSFQEFGPDYRAFSDKKLEGGFYKSKNQSTTQNGAVLVVIYAKNLEESKQTIESNGGKIVKEIFSFPGGRRFHFSDPHGNELAVWSDN